MKNQFRMFKRGNVFWCQNNETGKQESLRTKDPKEAEILLHHKNEAGRLGALNRQIGRNYLRASNPELATRTWRNVMESIVALKTGSTKIRWERAIRDKAFNSIRDRRIEETTASNFVDALNAGKVATNEYLKRIHNHALGMQWLMEPVIPKRKWPVIKPKEKRAITREEHEKILRGEPNEERRAYYGLCWHLGASQTDMAELKAEQFDRKSKQLRFHRRKTNSLVSICFGVEAEQILDQLPKSGPLFPYLSSVRANDRATEFKQRCRQLGIEGVTLHSYRYSWAERAAVCGYPERHAQMALGHHSQAIHRAYSKKAQMTLPALEDYEKNSLNAAAGVK